MYGWRGRIGAIVPSTNTVVEPEFWRMAPDGVSIHAARMHVETRATTDNLRDMTKHAYQAGRDLMTARVGTMVYACTSGSFIEGHGWEHEFRDQALGVRGDARADRTPEMWAGQGANLLGEVLHASRPQVLTTFQAVVTALHTVSAKRLIVASAYPEFLNVELRSSLEKHGFSVAAIAGLGLENPVEIGVVGPEVPYNLARSIATRDADAVFISCTNLRTIEIIQRLEGDLGIPVVTSNQASFWLALRMLGINDRLSEWGSLLDRPVDDALRLASQSTVAQRDHAAAELARSK
jgi:maleate isomerase